MGLERDNTNDNEFINNKQQNGKVIVFIASKDMMNK